MFFLYRALSQWSENSEIFDVHFQMGRKILRDLLGFGPTFQRHSSCQKPYEAQRSYFDFFVDNLMNCIAKLGVLNLF